MRALGLRRLFLHAAQITFDAPGGDRIRVTAPTPADLKSVLDAL
jgi:23S rRNA-/tRNA-specific pseudouridylate synthase